MCAARLELASDGVSNGELKVDTIVAAYCFSTFLLSLIRVLCDVAVPRDLSFLKRNMSSYFVSCNQILR